MIDYKIFIIHIDIDEALNVCSKLENNKDMFSVAKIFHTNVENKNTEYKYYVSEDQLNLDYKNNALLYIITDNDQNSMGITLDNYYSSTFIPATIKTFNNIRHNFIENNLIVWIDSKMNKDKYSKIEYNSNMIESKYLLSNLDKRYDNSYMYFSPNDSIDDIIKTIMEYIEGDDATKSKLLDENK